MPYNSCEAFIRKFHNSTLCFFFIIYTPLVIHGYVFLTGYFLYISYLPSFREKHFYGCLQFLKVEVRSMLVYVCLYLEWTDF